MIKLIGFILIVLVLATAVVPLTLRRRDGANQFAEVEAALHKLAIILLILLVLFTIPACTTTKPEPPLPDVVLIPPPPVKVNIPAETLKPCLPIPKLEDRVYTEVEVLQWVSGPVAVHADCRKRQADAVKTLRRAFNLN